MPVITGAMSYPEGLVDKMKAAGVDVRLHVKEKMGHVYPLWPSPEGRKARHEIAKIIKTCES